MIWEFQSNAKRCQNFETRNYYETNEKENKNSYSEIIINIEYGTFTTIDDVSKRR